MTPSTVLPRPKPTLLDKCARDWLNVHCELHDFGLETPGTCVTRPSILQLDRHLKASMWWDRLPPIRLYEVAQHCHGLTTLHVAPKRRATGRAPGLTVCLRIRSGGDSVGAEALLGWLSRLHRGLLYHERTDDGYLAYATYVLPKMPGYKGGKDRFLSNNRGHVAK
jgi:hypothetical protein